jgi:hypothetical protein
MRKKYFEQPFLSLLPFLLVYALIVIFQDPDSLMGDEGRYLSFADNLLNGFYSPPPPEINLWNGPGFPLYLLPFVALKLPLIVIRLFNALLYYGVLLLFNKTLSIFLDLKRSFHFTLLFACYYMPYKSLPFILSETLTVFLIASITLVAARYFTQEGKHRKIKHTLILAMMLAFLALTKVVFGMVFLFAGMLFLFLFLLTKNRSYRRSSVLLFCALSFCIPYLIYTYSLTGKIFYWSNAGGMSAYWMSNPVQGEYGEWHNDSLSTPPMDAESLKMLRSNHENAFEEIYRYNGVQRDDAFKEHALRNVKEHPLKFFQNWIANWSRMFFNYPVSYIPLRIGTVGNMLANIPVLILLAYSAFLTWWNKNRLPYGISFLLYLSAMYLMVSSLLSAYDRMFYVLAPAFGLWIIYSVSFLRKSKT